jgi:hypothetical protein
MARKRHKPEEIVAKLRQVDVRVSQGQSIADAIRTIGVSEGSRGGECAPAPGGRRAHAGQADPARGRAGKLLLYSGRMAQLLIRCCRLGGGVKDPAELLLLSGVGAAAAAMLGSEGMGGAI